MKKTFVNGHQVRVVESREAEVKARFAGFREVTDADLLDTSPDAEPTDSAAEQVAVILPGSTAGAPDPSGAEKDKPTKATARSDR
ncbi:MAG: hypothetical protein JWP14_3374 [Frankiales bacterium]|nr:hypothetical protein [Frankiales bacterium]